MLEEWQIRRFARHVLLDEVGGAGQRRLLDACVGVPSLDESGRACAMWLARSGVGALMLPDDRSAAPSTDPAGLLHASDAGRPVGEAVRQRLLEHLPALRFEPRADLEAEASKGVEGALDVVRRLTRRQELS